ncbi:hypothetical protein EYF80_021058 [Liparis tanakae]|uniref:Uncharacterized protein n=1 Tax=Liparis tanakae TaxID=230148 RepID=A0A4Z2HSC2_9TELE|nr:hypothetical protein EYF80_021058 [Liparis tanakae]
MKGYVGVRSLCRGFSHSAKSNHDVFIQRLSEHNSTHAAALEESGPSITSYSSEPRRLGAFTFDINERLINQERFVLKLLLREGPLGGARRDEALGSKTKHSNSKGRMGGGKVEGSHEGKEKEPGMMRKEHQEMGRNGIFKEERKRRGEEVKQSTKIAKGYRREDGRREGSHEGKRRSQR